MNQLLFYSSGRHLVNKYIIAGLPDGRGISQFQARKEQKKLKAKLKKTKRAKKSQTQFNS